MAPRLADRFVPLLPTFMPPLLQLCSRSNKVAMKRAERSLYLIAKHCRIPGMIRYLLPAIRDKASSLRAISACCLAELIESCDADHLARRIDDIDLCVIASATDASAEVRSVSRRLVALYEDRWPQHIDQCVSACREVYSLDRLTARLSPTAMRNLFGAQAPQRMERCAGVQRVRGPSAEPRMPRSIPQSMRHASASTSAHTLQHAPRERVVSPWATAQQNLASSSAHVAPAAVHGDEVETAPQQDVPSEPAASASSGIHAPRAGAAPSDGVRYRLALAEEQMRARAAQASAARSSSGAATRLRPTSMTIGARKTHETSSQRPAAARVPCAPPATHAPPRAQRVRASNTQTVSAHAPAAATVLRPDRRRDEATFGAADAPSTPRSAQGKSPPKSTPRQEFTPQRRPLSVMDENRHTPRVVYGHDKADAGASPLRRTVAE